MKLTWETQTAQKIGVEMEDHMTRGGVFKVVNGMATALVEIGVLLGESEMNFHVLRCNGVTRRTAEGLRPRM